MMQFKMITEENQYFLLNTVSNQIEYKVISCDNFEELVKVEAIKYQDRKRIRYENIDFEDCPEQLL